MRWSKMSFLLLPMVGLAGCSPPDFTDSSTSACMAPSVGNLGPGRVDVPLIAAQEDEVGAVTIHNDNGGLLIDVNCSPEWRLTALHVHAGWPGDPVPMNRRGAVRLADFPIRYTFASPVEGQRIWLDFATDLDGFRWGQADEAERIRHISVHARVVRARRAARGGDWANRGRQAWALGQHAFERGRWGWWLEYAMARKAKAHFVDAPVQGLRAVTPTTDAITDAAGGFEYFPGEDASLLLGSQLLGEVEADHRITPVDLFVGAAIDDTRVVNMARLLQTLDVDGQPTSGITVSPEVLACLETALLEEGLVVDWSDTQHVDALIASTIAACQGQVTLLAVSAADALDNLEKGVGSSMFRKNVSKTPELETTKSKLEMMPILVPALEADGDPYPDGIDYFDEDGNLIENRTHVKPLVAVYADELTPGGAADVFGAVSRDDGKTWKRTNLSRAADRSSFTLANGAPYYGDVKKPNIKIKGNHMLVAWQSKFCRGGRPLYAAEELLPDGTPNPLYVDDIWGVGGPQRSHDYAEDGFPEVGELPFYCLWVARGTIDETTGDISWRKPERLTSGRRDVWQISINGAGSVGFGVVWQEDPKGVRPGEGAGPGHGWSGATTNHKTDIWYSFIRWSDFAPIDPTFSPNGDPEHAFDDPEWTSNRPMPLVPFSLPMRLSDNDICNTDNMKVVLGSDGLPPTDGAGNYTFTPIIDPTDPEWDGKNTGTHRYCYLVDGACDDFHTFTNAQGETKHVCVTADGRLLDGDTGAARPNLMFMPFTKPDGTKSAWASIVYEETKGVGAGSVEWDDDDSTTHEEEKAMADLGKLVIYHSFEFASPVPVNAGGVANLPSLDENGNLVYLVDALGQRLLDWQGLPQLAYENARRPRMLVQPPGQAGPAGTVLVLVYKQGEDGKGRPSDIFLRRIRKAPGGNPFAFGNFACNTRVISEAGQSVCIDGALNLSSVTPVEYWANPDQDDQAKGEGTKVVRYVQTEANLHDASWTNPYDDARAHRGILRGDDVFVAYDYTPNWAAARNAHDKFDLFVRRSFDGGQTWTTDPAGAEDICHTRLWKDYTGAPSEEEANKRPTYEETACFAPGAFEPGRNISLLRNNKLSVIEPRLVGPANGPPGSPYPEDVRNVDVFWLTFGTETNVPKPHGLDEEEEAEVSAPADLFYTFTRDKGQTYFKRVWEINADSSGTWAGETVERFDYLAKGDAEQGEAQIRMSPDGSRFHAVWNESGPEGSDTWYRRIMSPEFPQNVAPAP